MVSYDAEVKKYFNLSALGQDEGAESALFYYSLFNPKMYEDEGLSDPKTEYVKEKLTYYLNLVGSNKKDINTIIEEAFSPEKDIITCLLLARRLRKMKFEVEPNFRYGGLEIDLFNEQDKIAIELKRVYSTNNFYKETFETSKKYSNKNLKNKILLLFLLPCENTSHIETVKRATIGFKTFVQGYKNEKN